MYVSALLKTVVLKIVTPYTMQTGRQTQRTNRSVSVYLWQRACCVSGRPNHCPTCSNTVANTFRTLCSLHVVPLTGATHTLSALLSLVWAHTSDYLSTSSASLIIYLLFKHCLYLYYLCISLMWKKPISIPFTLVIVPIHNGSGIC